MGTLGCTLLLFLTPGLSARAEVPPDDERDLDGFTLEDTAASEASLGWTAAAGTAVGPVFPLNSPLSITGMGRLEVGVSPPALGGRLMGVAGLSYVAPRAQGALVDDTAQEPIHYELRQRTLLASAGLELRALDRSEAVSPVFAIGPALLSSWTVVSGDGLADAREQQLRPGLYLGGGIAIEAGPGTAALRMDYVTARLDGALSGEASLSLLQPNFGYRVHL